MCDQNTFDYRLKSFWVGRFIVFYEKVWKKKEEKRKERKEEGEKGRGGRHGGGGRTGNPEFWFQAYWASLEA